jgi:mannosyltransferase OCH1-like enzyme
MKYNKKNIIIIFFLLTIFIVVIMTFFLKTTEPMEQPYRIEKNVFQSWKTKDLKPEIQAKIDSMKRLNPEYTFYLFDDDEMDKFVNTNYPGPIADAYNRLNIIVAKVDFWRYLVLYKYGGVYLDMDSEILVSLDDNLIRPEDEAILTEEKNPGLLVQWALIFRKEHPILKRVIDVVLENIQAGKTEMIETTGPGAFTKAVRQVHEEINRQKTEAQNGLLMNTQEVASDQDRTFQGPSFSYRVFGTDYNGTILFADDNKQILYNDNTHWRTEVEKKPFYKDS